MPDILSAVLSVIMWTLIFAGYVGIMIWFCKTVFFCDRD